VPRGTGRLQRLMMLAYVGQVCAGGRKIPAPTHPLRSTLVRVTLLSPPSPGGCMNEAAMRSAVQPLGWAISNELRL
jgi:hypothetical protein